MTPPLTFSVPALPSSLNAWTRAHWRVRNTEREQWAELVRPRLLLAGLRSGRPMFDAPCRVTLHYRVARRKHGQRFDLDNLAPKHLLDAMRGWVWPDDSASYVAELVQTVAHDADEDGTVVVVEPL